MTTCYRLDPTQGRFTVQAFAVGMLSFLGHSPTFAVRDFSGEARFDPAAPESTSVRVAVRADSLQMEDKVSDADRRQIEDTMRGETLETARFPEVVFESTEVRAGVRSGDDWPVRITGRMTLHGLTRSIGMDARLTLYSDGVRLAGGFTLSQSEFGMKPVVALGGTLRLKDPVQAAFNVVGWKVDD